MDKLDKVIRKKSYFNTYQSTYICFIAKKVIDKEINTKVIIESYRAKSIKVRMKNPYLVTEAGMKKEKIIQSINKQAGKDIVKNIRFTM